MTTPVDRFLAALRNHGHEPRKAGAGWCCTCPGHDDRNPSLSINTGEDGRALVNCHAGCTFDALCRAIELRPADLFSPDPNRRNGHAPRNRPSVAVTRTLREPARNAGIGDGDVRTFPTAHAGIAELERRHGPRSATWTYHNAAGLPVGLTFRRDRPGGGKIVRYIWRTADGRGWLLESGPKLHPLYGLPDLLATPAGTRIFIVEGEKAAEAARAVGLVATTSAGGAKRAKGTDWSPLAEFDAVMLPGHDAPGERYAGDVAKLVTAANAKSVRVVRLVDLWAEMPEGGDMADFVAHRGGGAEAIRAEIEALADRTEPECAAPQASVVARLDLNAVMPSRTAYARDYLAALSLSTQTPLEMPTLLGLAIASAAVCNVARVRGHGDHIEPAQLWALVLCEPAVRKSAVLAELLAPIVAWEKRRSTELGPMIAAAVQRRKIDEKRLKSIEDNAARHTDPKRRASSSDEAVRLSQAMQAEPIPTAPVLLASEPTPEALARQMAANRGRALLASAEADALDIVQGRYSGSRNYGILLKGHAGDAVRAQRVGRPGDTIDHPALAVALCVQPQAVRDLWVDPHAEGRGLLARFAVVLPRDRIGHRDVRPPPVPESVRVKWRSAIDRLLTFEPSDAPFIVELGPASDALFHDFQKRTETALGIGDLAERPAWGGKLCGLALRVALTLHALETWALTGKPDDFPTIDAATMRAAIAWADYLASAEHHAGELLGESAAKRATRLLIHWINRKGGTVTARDLTHGLRAYRGDSDAAERALSALVDAGIGCWAADAHGPKGGRPAQRFRLVTTVTVTETPTNAGNEVGNGDGEAADTSTNIGDGSGEVGP